MITSIFSKSKPINFIIVFFITLIAFLQAIVLYNTEVITTTFVIKKVLLFIAIYFSVLLLNFIVTKNGLAQKNNFEILIFSLLILILPQTTHKVDLVVSNLFILLALRRLFSLYSKKDTKKKLLDAAILITIASLFYAWAFLFFICIFFALIVYKITDLKNVLIPFIGSLACYLILQSASVIINNTFYILPYKEILPSLDFSHYNSTRYIVGLTLLLSLSLWSSFFYLKAINKKMKKIRPALILLFIVSIIALIIAIFSPVKSGSEFLFLFAPLAVIIANYLEMIEEKWFKEVFVSIFVIVPIVLLLL